MDILGTHVDLNLAFERPTEGFSDSLNGATNFEIVTPVAHFSANSRSVPYNEIATPGYQHDHQVFGETLAEYDHLQPPPWAPPAADGWTNASMFDDIPELITGPAEDIHGFSQENLAYPLGGQPTHLSRMDDFGRSQPDDEVPDIFGATHAAEAPTSGQQVTAPPSVPADRQSPGSTNTDVSARHRCGTCGLRFKGAWDVYLHCESTGHHELGCPILDCDFTSRDIMALRNHKQEAHPELHTCNQCRTAVHSIAALGDHASKTGHASFFCPKEGCEKAYARFDVLQRHQDTHRSDIRRFPCPHCRKHRGVDSFKRKDHLTQHLRNYHHIGVDELNMDYARARSCPHEDCSEWRSERTWGKQHAFQKSSDYITHMRKVHKESEFPCSESGCERTGPKGYFRMRDLQKHKLKEHGIPIV